MRRQFELTRAVNLVPPASIADEINAAHAEAERSLRTSVQCAIRAGELLIEAKRRHGRHSQWAGWLEENVKFSDRLAQAYMRIARTPVEKRNAVADLPLREALSAIRSREKKLADAEERKSRVCGRSGFYVKQPDGSTVIVPAPNFVVAPEHQHLLPPPEPAPSAPPALTSGEIADGLINQLAQVAYEARDNIDLADLRAAFARRFGEDARQISPSSIIGPVDRCRMHFRAMLFEILYEMPTTEWGELFAAVRDELADVERVAEQKRGQPNDSVHLP